MKKNNFCTIATLLLLFVVGFSSCVNDKDRAGELPGAGGSPDNNTLVFNFAVNVPIDVATYADPVVKKQTDKECEIENVYTLYFKPVAGAQNKDDSKYLGYSRTGKSDITIESGTKNKGSYSATVPASVSVDENLDILVLANIDDYINKGWMVEGEQLSTGQYIAQLLENKTYAYAVEQLKMLFTDSKGFNKRLLPMSGTGDKMAGKDKTLVEVKLTRRVARIDLVNESQTTGTTGSIRITSVTLYNAPKQAYIHKLGPVIPFKDDDSQWNTEDYYLNYKEGKLVKDATNDINTKVEAMLYAFPNFVRQPTMKDSETTCLIIGGHFKPKDGTEESEETFYRINISAKNASEQKINANGLYTIKITNVTKGGAINDDQAWNTGQPIIDYTINEWDDSILGTHNFDQYGNSLAASTRNVTFGNKGGQEIDIKIFAANGDIKPISSDWQASLKGENADAFEFVVVANDSPKGPNTTGEGTITVKTKKDNSGITNLEAFLEIKWGDIDEEAVTLDINLKQLSLLTNFEGFTVTPKDVLFTNTGGTQEIIVHAKGNFGQVDFNKVTAKKLAVHSGDDLRWISEPVPIPQTAEDKKFGILRYKITTTPNNDPNKVRKALLKFVLNTEDIIATAEANVVQSNAIVEDDPVDTFNLIMYLDNDGSGKYITTHPSKIIGLPAKFGTNEQELNKTMFFAQMPKDNIYYEIHLETKYDYTIEPLDNELSGENLDIEVAFKNTSSAGYHKSIITVKAKYDQPLPWSGGFVIVYSNGKTKTIPVVQEGTYATMFGKPIEEIYFYGIMNVLGYQWLDRNIGEIKGNYYDQISSFSTKENLSPNVSLNVSDAGKTCPKGFRLPTQAEAETLLSAVRSDKIKSEYTLKISESLWDPSTRASNYVDKLIPFSSYFAKIAGLKGVKSMRGNTYDQAHAAVALMLKDDNIIYAAWNNEHSDVWNGVLSPQASPSGNTFVVGNTYGYTHFQLPTGTYLSTGNRVFDPNFNSDFWVDWLNADFGLGGACVLTRTNYQENTYEGLRINEHMVPYKDVEYIWDNQRKTAYDVKPLYNSIHYRCIKDNSN